MKTNAAVELHTLFAGWMDHTTVGVIAQRQSDGGLKVAEAMWRDQERAVTLLAEVEAFVRQSGDYDAGDASLIEMLREFIWQPHVEWHSAVSGVDLPLLAMKSLRLLGKLMESSPRAVQLDDAQVVALRAAIEKCLDLLGVSSASVEETGEYVAYLLKRCRDILDGERVGLITLHDLSFQVVGEALSDERLWVWDQSESFFANIAVIARVWGQRVATKAATDAASTLLLDGSKIALQAAGGVVAGLLDPPRR